MYDLITIGDITVDLFFQGRSLTATDDRFSLAIGGKYLADSFYQGVGGGAANVAIDASSHDLDVAACGVVGENSFKQLIIQHLVKKNVSTELLIFEKDFVNISSILLSVSGEKTVIHYPSTDVTFTIPDNIERQLLQAKSYFIGHLPQASLRSKIALLGKLSTINVPIFLNIGRDDLEHPIEELLPIFDKINVLILNAYEFATLAKKDKSAIDFHTDVSGLIKLNGKLLIITDAQNGSYAYHEGQVYTQKAVKVEKIIDTTGVGDAYAASFIANFLKEGDVQTSMEKASTYASKKLTRLGAN